MIETEIWGIIEKNEFPKILKEITGRLGKAQKKKRLAIEISDWSNQNLDTRIRITDGQAELVQKVGAWKARKKKEIQVDLPQDTELIMELVEILSNYVMNGNPRVQIFQYENFIFKTSEYELKLSHQFGKGSRFNFEIEALIKDVDLLEIANQFGLEEHNKKRDIAFWDKWNEVVSLNVLKLNKRNLKSMLKKYLV